MSTARFLTPRRKYRVSTGHPRLFASAHDQRCYIRNVRFGWKRNPFRASLPPLRNSFREQLPRPHGFRSALPRRALFVRGKTLRSPEEKARRKEYVRLFLLSYIAFFVSFYTLIW